VRSTTIACLATLALLLAGCGGQQAADQSEDAAAFPTDDIRLLVPYAAGGPTDLTARTYGEFLERDLGRPVVVENRPGGSGALATQELAQSEPDGHTLALITAGTTVLTPLVNDVGYTSADVTPVGVLSEVPSLLAVGKESPYQDMAAFVADAKARPGAINVGVPGASTPPGLELQRLRDEHGVEVTVVPFNGNSEMTAALLGGNVDAVLINASQDVTENIDAGEFRPLAVSTEQPLDWLPGIPTLVEAGFPGLTLSGSTFGLAGPAGLPEPVVTRLEDALRRGHADPDVMATIGERYLGPEFRGAAEMRAVLDQTQAAYEPILGGS
jgi:tripartite-type tricarboxylate transporter receptor subunit TctC